MKQLYDDTPFVTVDYVKKTMDVPEYYKVIGVEGDDNSRRVYFKLVKTPDDINVMESTVSIIYVNANKECGRYLCDDVAEDASGNVTFSFLVPGSLCMKAGSVTIAPCIIGEGYEWHITPYKVKVSSFGTHEPILEETSPEMDLYNQLLMKVNTLIKFGVEDELQEATEDEVYQLWLETLGFEEGDEPELYQEATEDEVLAAWEEA